MPNNISKILFVGHCIHLSVGTVGLGGTHQVWVMCNVFVMMFCMILPIFSLDLWIYFQL